MQIILNFNIYISNILCDVHILMCHSDNVTFLYNIMYLSKDPFWL